MNDTHPTAEAVAFDFPTTATSRSCRWTRCVIGPDERICAHDGLRALTIDAAYQYGEEDRKGSIAPGKLADLTILDATPTRVDPAAIKDIKVSETIKEGKTVFKR